MEFPQTNHPHLELIGQSLQRSLQLHIVDNEMVRSAFAELEFELELARQLDAPVPVGLLEPTL